MPGALTFLVALCAGLSEPEQSSLDLIVEAALRHSLETQQQLYRLAQAEATVTEQGGAFVPSAALMAQSGFGQNGFVSDEQAAHITTASATLKQPLLQASALAAYRGARRERQAAVERLQVTRLQVAQQAVGLYAAAARLRALQDLQAERLERALQQKAIATALHAAGLREAQDPWQADASALRAQGDLARTEASLALAMAELRKLTALPQSAVRPSDAYVRAACAGQPATGDTMQAHPARQAALQEVAAESLRQDANTLRWLPNVHLETRVDTTPLTPFGPSWFVGISATLSPPSLPAYRAERRRRSSAIAQAVGRRAMVERSLQEDFLGLRRSVTALCQSREAALAGSLTQRRYADYMLASYRAGLHDIDAAEVRRASDAYSEAQEAKVQLDHDLLVQAAALQVALGHLPDSQVWLR